MTTISQAMRNVIEAERAAARFYEEMLDRATDAPTRTFLKDMVALEQRHAAAIEELAARRGIGALPDEANEDMDLVATAPEWKSAKEISLIDAVHLAIEAEQHAALYYDAVADHWPGEAGEFFRQLARDEEQHAELLRGLLPSNE